MNYFPHTVQMNFYFVDICKEINKYLQNAQHSVMDYTVINIFILMMVAACCVVDLWLCKRQRKKAWDFILIQNVDNHC